MIKVAVLVLVLLPGVSAQAVKVKTLYQAEIPVISQAADSREQAVRDGFLQVLIKVSGDPQVEKNPLIRSSLNRAEYYVHDYSFSTETPESSQYLLQIQYEPRDINRLLKKARVAYWGENRPLILVWVAMSGQDDEAVIIGNDSGSAVFRDMRKMGQKYGLPLIFPMMDVSEITFITPQDVTSMAMETLNEASKRYHPDVLLVGDIEATVEGVQSKWQMQMNTGQWSWRISEKTLDAVAAAILNQVNQTLLAQYDLRPAFDRDTLLHIEVSHIFKPDDLSRLIRYFKKMTGVETVELSEVEDDRVDLSVLIRGPVDAFRQQIVTGSHLVLKSENQDMNRLSYEWVR